MRASPPCRAPAVHFDMSSTHETQTQNPRCATARTQRGWHKPEPGEPPQVAPNRQSTHCPPKQSPKTPNCATPHNTDTVTPIKIAQICQREMNETAGPCLEIRRGKQRRGSKRCISRSNAWRPSIRSNSSSRRNLGLLTRVGVHG